MPSMQYWLMKSEPDTFSIDDLARVATEPWTGVRNFQARNNLQRMDTGDEVLFYHSSCREIGVYGRAMVVKGAYPDPTQFDSTSDYFDPRSRAEKPLWYCVDVSFVEKFGHPVLIETMRHDESLDGMALLQNSRLSVQPVSEAHFRRICSEARR